jgi:hypothetical protein
MILSRSWEGQTAVGPHDDEGANEKAEGPDFWMLVYILGAASWIYAAHCVNIRSFEKYHTEKSEL